MDGKERKFLLSFSHHHTTGPSINLQNCWHSAGGWGCMEWWTYKLSSFWCVIQSYNVIIIIYLLLQISKNLLSVKYGRSFRFIASDILNIKLYIIYINNILLYILNLQTKYIYILNLQTKVRIETEIRFFKVKCLKVTMVTYPC